MLSNSSFAANIRFADILDVAVIALLLYIFLTWVQRRASRAMVATIALIILLYAIARITNMYLTLSMFKIGLTAALVVAGVAFQDEIRLAIERIFSYRSYRQKYQLVASPKTFDIVVEAASNLARDKIGALIVIKGREMLDRHLSGGTSLNGRLSISLLYSIFHPETPSHDGAVIIEADRIEKFGVRLPLSHNIKEVGDRGTRHTSGLGISERTDSFVVIVSEERGSITVAEGGNLHVLNKTELHDRLSSFYQRIFPPKPEKKRFFGVTNNLLVKIGSIGLAVLIWIIFAYRTETLNRTFDIPVEYRNIPANWIVETPSPAEVRISLSGMERAFTFDPSKLTLSIDMSTPKELIQSVPTLAQNINVPSGIKINQITPKFIAIKAYTVIPVTIPIKVITRGNPPPNIKIIEIKPNPESVQIMIPPSKQNEILEIPTEPISLSAIGENNSFKIKLKTLNNVRFQNEEQRNVKVTITGKAK